jgi:predicted phosphodiesterase
MNDDHLFSPQDAVALHELMLENINSELDKPFEGKKVLITHHGVHSQSVHLKYRPNINSLESALKLPGENSSWMLNPYFVSDLPDLLKKVDVAIHGHTHESLDYIIEKTRVITNPRGYPFTDTNGDIVFENKMYKPFHIFEI